MNSAEARQGPWSTGTYSGANTALRDADLSRRCQIEAAEGRQDLGGAVGDYERQMFEYGVEAVRHSLGALPSFLPEPRTADVKR
ncbi:hypothetical protein [Amycolatopsis sp. cmx-11-51]|uniref:hypothetical protein n=1 Tax=unclassified Amycolatopsis TaxID=2618356 RepID=UPI0039E31A4C